MYSVIRSVYASIFVTPTIVYQLKRICKAPEHRDPNRNSGSVSLLPENAQWPPYSVREEGDLARRYFVLESGEEVPASTSAFSKSQSPSSSSSSTSYSSTQQLPVRIGSRLGHRTCYFLTQHLPRVLRGAFSCKHFYLHAFTLFVVLLRTQIIF